MCVQVLDKYGDIYGRERIAELLGVDLASLDVSQQHEKKQEEPDTSVFAWYVKTTQRAVGAFVMNDTDSLKG